LAQNAGSVSGLEKSFRGQELAVLSAMAALRPRWCVLAERLFCHPGVVAFAGRPAARSSVFKSALDWRAGLGFEGEGRLGGPVQFHALKLLDRYRGIVQCDGYVANAARDEAITLALCWTFVETRRAPDNAARVYRSMSREFGYCRRKS
jgi:hypothetical protein